MVNKSKADVADIESKVMVISKVAQTIKVIVKTKVLSFGCPRLIHKSMLVPILFVVEDFGVEGDKKKSKIMSAKCII